MRVNGKTVKLRMDMTLLEYLHGNRMEASKVMVRRNGVEVPKSEYRNTILNEGDDVEIIQTIGNV